MHALLENLDFQTPELDPDFIDLQLANFGYHTAQWQKTITKLIFDVWYEPRLGSQLWNLSG